MEREERAIAEQTDDLDGAQQSSGEEEAVPVAAEPVDDPWEGFLLDDYVLRDG